MSLALVKYTVRKNGRTRVYVDYISLEVAKLGLEVHFDEYNLNVWAVPEIIKIYK